MTIRGIGKHLPRSHLALMRPPAGQGWARWARHHGCGRAVSVVAIQRAKQNRLCHSEAKIDGSGKEI